MVLGSKKLGSLITKFELSDDGSRKRQQQQAADKSPAGRDTRKRLTPKQASSTKLLVSARDIKIGDKIKLSDSPWRDCEGIFRCKAIRRPDFAESAVVAYGGAAGARAVAQSSKQYLMVVDRHIVEVTRMNEISARVVFVSSVDDIFKVKLRDEEDVISLFFTEGKDDPFIYNCHERSIVSQQIRAAKGSGLVKREAIHKALHLIQEIQAQERALEYDPTLARVNEITLLYERAVQQFAIAGDMRHAEVEEHKMKFLALPKVASIRKGTPQKPKAERKIEPEILETSFNYSSDIGWGGSLDSNDTPQNAVDCCLGDNSARQKNKPSIEGVNDFVAEARQDFEKLNVSDGVASDKMDRDEGGATTGNNGDSYVFAEFDAMLTAAERELDEIRNM